MDKYDNGVSTSASLKTSKFVSWFAYAWAMFGVAILLLRTFLLATSADMGAGFSRFIYRTSLDYMQPFRGIFPGAKINDTGYLDISALFAAMVYLFIGWGLKEIVVYVQQRIDREHEAQKEYMLRKTMQEGTSKMDSVEMVARGRVSNRQDQ